MLASGFPDTQYYIDFPFSASKHMPTPHILKRNDFIFFMSYKKKPGNIFSIWVFCHPWPKFKLLQEKMNYNCIGSGSLLRHKWDYLRKKMIALSWDDVRDTSVNKYKLKRQKYRKMRVLILSAKACQPELWQHLAYHFLSLTSPKKGLPWGDAVQYCTASCVRAGSSACRACQRTAWFKGLTQAMPAMNPKMLWAKHRYLITTVTGL